MRTPEKKTRPVAEWIRALACTGDRTVRDGFELRISLPNKGYLCNLMGTSPVVEKDNSFSNKQFKPRE